MDDAIFTHEYIIFVILTNLPVFSFAYLVYYLFVCVLVCVRVCICLRVFQETRKSSKNPQR